MEGSIEANLAVLNKNRAFINMVELRLDMLEDPLELSPYLVKLKLNISTIITYRKKIDGGNYSGPEDQRRSVLYKWFEAGFEYIDLEIETSFPEIEKSAVENGTRIIRSYHNFNRVPDNLEEIIRNLSGRPGEIAKAAVFPNTSRETLKFFKIIDRVKDIEDKIILGMGDFGLPSRILYKKLGSMISFCSNQENSGAPGQITPIDMNNLYRVKKITNSTSVYGIIGNPVMHSQSPFLHNSAYQRVKLDAVYIPFLVDSIDHFIKMAELLKIEGFSVTVPYKVEIMKYLDEKGPELDAVLSCNTVVRKDNLWKGFNTDPDGFLKPLLSLVDVKSFHTCAVIGAGGAARAVIKALQSIGKVVSIFNRSESRAGKLALEMSCSYYPLTMQESLYDFDLIVQTTTVGMTPDENKTPIPEYKFRSEQIAYDIIYTPLKTKFLKDAEASGAIIIGGMEMLKTQGIKQFEIFTNQLFPFEEQKGNF